MKKNLTHILIVIFIASFFLSTCKPNLVKEETPSFDDETKETSEISSEAQSEAIVPVPTMSVTSIPEDVEDIISLKDFAVNIEVSHSAINEVDFELMQSLGVKYIRFNGILWSEIQPTENSFVWDGMKAKEEFFRKANQNGITIIPIVRSTPVWAQKVYGYYCGAILDEKLDSFGLFMRELVNRYKSDEFNIHYWEIWNEPDVQPEFVRNTSVYGCWGDANDPYYGGGNYANLLKVIYPIIKEVDVNSKLLVGGLLLDCDPFNVGETGRCQEGKEIPPKFLEGILLSGGGNFFDIVSFHGYTTDRDFERTPWDLEQRFFNWSARGGVIMGKYRFLTELLSNYGVDKEIFLTETGYICLDKNPSCNNDLISFYDRQAQYGMWLFVRNWIEGIDQSFWYTFNGPGWRQSGILDKEQQPKPVYSSLQILNERMEGALTAQKLADLPDGLQGYKIVFDEKTTWVVVSSDNESHNLDLSAASFSAFDVFNNEIESQNGILEIFNPVYIDFDM